MTAPGLSHPTVGVGAASAQVAELQAAEKSIKAQLQTLTEQLRSLDQKNVPDSQPWLTFKRVNSIQELKSLHPSLRSALREDISQLQATRRQLESELEAARRQSSLAAVKAREHAANQHYHDFEHRMQELLSRWKATGKQPEAELELLLGVAEKVMKEQISVLNADPSHENMKALLVSMKNLSLFGRNTDEGWRAVRQASERRLNKSANTLRGNPTRANIGEVLNCSREAQLLGSDTAGEQGIRAALYGAEKLREAAERQFRSMPSVSNFQILFRAQHEEALLGGESAPPDHPRGLRDALRGTTHTVRAGETLSQLSARYFGNPGFWDVILWRNVGRIRDPNILPVGQTLTIA